MAITVQELKLRFSLPRGMKNTQAINRVIRSSWPGGDELLNSLETLHKIQHAFPTEVTNKMLADLSTARAKIGDKILENPEIIDQFITLGDEPDPIGISNDMARFIIGGRWPGGRLLLDTLDRLKELERGFPQAKREYLVSNLNTALKKISAILSNDPTLFS